MPNQQETHSYVERKAEALVLLRHLKFDFQRAASILNIPKDQLQKWAENFDDTWKEQIPNRYLKQQSPNPVQPKQRSGPKMSKSMV